MIAILTLIFVLSSGDPLTVTAPMSSKECEAAVRRLQESGQAVAAHCEPIRFPPAFQPPPVLT